MNPRSCPRRTITPTHLPLLADEMWALSDNPHFSWFCQSACFVDEHEPLTVRGVSRLALRLHLPGDRSAIGLTAGPKGEVEAIAQFATLGRGYTSTPLWRCDMNRENAPPVRFAIAGTHDGDLLREFGRADMLMLVKTSAWEDWDLADVCLTFPNDPEYWLTCGA